MNISVRPRKHYRRYAAVIAAVASVVLLASGLPASSRQAAAFDLDNGNALNAVIYPALNGSPRAEWLNRPMTLAVDYVMLVEVPWLDALAPYHPTAVGIYSDLGRRPAAEQTNRNKNIALIYSSFTSLNAVLPQYRANWIGMMNTAGLDPANTAEDPATPSGIGILAAKRALAARAHDGTNRYGDEGHQKYNRQPFSDFTGYRPVNTVYELRNPSRWQPDRIWKRNVSTIQEFATPQFSRLRPYSFRSAERFNVPPPVRSDHRNKKAYKAQADEVLKASAELDDRQKMTAEFFDDNIDNIRPFGAVASRVLFGRSLSLDDSVFFVVGSDLAGTDVVIASWYLMRKYDSVRPFSAIRHVYGNRKVTAWGGPGKGTVGDIPGDEWQGYLGTRATASPEYPSAQTAGCLAYAQHTRRFLGSDAMDITIPVPKGSSVVEPGITPAADLTLHWSNLTDWASDCGKSRVWGGDNFPASVTAAGQYATQVGDLAYEFVQSKVRPPRGGPPGGPAGSRLSTRTVMAARVEVPSPGRRPRGCGPARRGRRPDRRGPAPRSPRRGRRTTPTASPGRNASSRARRRSCRPATRPRSAPSRASPPTSPPSSPISIDPSLR